MKFIDFLKKMKADKTQIPNSTISNLADYDKNLYYKMICMLLSNQKNITDNQTLLLSRMLAGVNAEHSLEDYMRMGQTVEVADFTEFSQKILVDELKKVFVFDILLLANIEKCENSYHKFLAEFIDSTGLNEKEVDEICKIAKCVIEQDLNLMFQAIDVDCKGYIQYDNQSTDEKFFLKMPKPTNVDLMQYSGFRFNQKQVILENLIINLCNNNLYFDNCQSIVLKNCKILGGSAQISFNNGQNILIESCKFLDFSNRCMITYGNPCIVIKNSEF